MNNPEQERLDEGGGPVPPWRKWGPYVSDREWGTVREDYSPDGAAWDAFPHDHGGSRAYRWGEDGIAGMCDRFQIIVFAFSFWNGRDAILKERFFGLTNSEGNHGEDVKEYYFHLDNTPTHSYMKLLYKYPQASFPYTQLVRENGRRGPDEPEYELLDTGVFDEDRYFDILMEYAKAGPEDLCIRVEVFNRGPDPAPIYIIPQLWFRNTWSWDGEVKPRPVIGEGPARDGVVSLLADDAGTNPLSHLPFSYRLGQVLLYGPEGGQPLFTENETNTERLWGLPGRTRWVKDAFHRRIIHGEESVNPDRRGTKACLSYGPITVPVRGSVSLVFRLCPEAMAHPLQEVGEILALRKNEADLFFQQLAPPLATADEKLIQRQALAGLLWSKQIYLFDVQQWHDGDRHEMPDGRRRARNAHWRHLNSMRIMLMPDKWEYPWFAAWDLAFQAVALSLVDLQGAKEQLWMLLFEQFMHPNGQIPAYEWEFSDLNPPVHAWAVWRVYMMEFRRTGRKDRLFLERCFHKLLINFAWWVNRVDHDGNNVFEGGFLGLDNITVVDRSRKEGNGARLEQSDATGWMGMFCQNLMRISLELAIENRAYEGMAVKFFEHYVYVGAAMKRMGGRDWNLWDEEDNFFYDVMRYEDGSFRKFRLRSLVGLIPLYAVERLRADWLAPFPEFLTSFEWFVRNRPDLVGSCVSLVKGEEAPLYAMTIVDEDQIRSILERVLDPKEFRSTFGLRSLSRYHLEHPFTFNETCVGYEPAESEARIMGGNSNWRGPIWFPAGFLMIESLRKLGQALGSDFRVQSPVPGEGAVPLQEMARSLADSMIGIFTHNERGERPVFGNNRRFQDDPYWRDCILFYEYFHGDTGAGLGASHQTGWTALVASLIDEWRR